MEYVTFNVLFYFTNYAAFKFSENFHGSEPYANKKTCVISAALLVLIKLGIAWVSFLAFNDAPGIGSSMLLGHIIDNYTYVGLKGLLIIGIIAMAMSTADSNMNIASVLFSHDICTTLKIGIKRDLVLAKIFSFLLGIGAIILAILGKDLLSIVLSANSFYMPVVTIPLIFTILGFRSTKQSVQIGMGAGFCTVILWKMLDIKTAPIIFGMLANTIFLFASHYILKQKGGWVGVKYTKYFDDMRIKKRKNSTKVLESIKKFNPFEFCKKYSPDNKLTYMGFGIYCIIYTITTMYSTQTTLSNTNGKIVLVIYQIMMITGTVMAMYPIWPLSIKEEVKKNIVQIWWNPAIFYMLVFFSGFFVMISDFGQLQFVIFTANTILIIILAGWKLAIGMIITGFYASVVLFKYYKNIDNFDITIGSPQFIFMYSLVLIGTVVVIFLKPKQEQQELTEKK